MKKIDEIDGVLLTPLKIIPVNKGNVFHAMKNSDPGFSGFAEAYFSLVNQGVIKGWKKHLEMTMNLVVIKGEIKFVAYDDREGSITINSFGAISLSRNNYFRLTIPPKLWVSFQGLAEENVLLNLANLTHEPDESVNLDLNAIEGIW
ncbi:dTDP-4-dehydrorhamnose 3,5-epimerase family protein [Leptospira vanthielii]|uniref:dTDP-4-dehydrorhamnose 3,5-epimerase n=1 Tax=Leptospira vanthielii serovar Holland str. Waz Holland = ATCC 700522 TaxID=1218591 RepID=N1W7Q1_9LEPT|nr:dTDP-4-dehydrorhamnose 3,5-epimerase family protein [Leptospira vanthielii]EMY69465.1 WxcM-like protein [Leptospira vanthielii serovar Holland str. Waz Holland = ATCC 700522]